MGESTEVINVYSMNRRKEEKGKTRNENRKEEKGKKRNENRKEGEVDRESGMGEK